MPIVSGKTVAAQAVANGSVNFAGGTDPIAVGGSAQSFQLDVPSLSRLTWVVIQTAGVDSIQVQPQVSFRRGVGGALIWVDILPAALSSPSGVPLVLSLNTVAVQAMRLVLSHTGAQGAPVVSSQYFLSGSA